MPIIDIVIPAHNEEQSIRFVIDDIPKSYIRNIVVGNNNSTDNTKIVAKEAGAIVVDAPKKGYGFACLKALDYIHNQDVKPDILVFLDGDYSDYPEQLIDLIKPIVEEDYELVIGSRALGNLQKGSMTPQQIFGNWLATNLIKLFFRYEFTDLGPFRAIRYKSFCELGMKDEDFGWTVEMQVKAAKMKMRTTEIPVDYRRRIGKSKVSGTIKGTILAGHKILWTIFKYL